MASDPNQKTIDPNLLALMGIARTTPQATSAFGAATWQRGEVR